MCWKWIACCGFYGTIFLSLILTLLNPTLAFFLEQNGGFMIISQVFSLTDLPLL